MAPSGQPPGRRRQHPHDGMVFCANCGEEMLKSGDRYYCRNSTAESGGKCTMIVVDAGRLTYFVVTKMVNRLATDEVGQSITKSITDATETTARAQRSKMEQTEAAIAKTNTRRPAVLHALEHGTKTYDEIIDEISELNQAKAGLTFESMVARNELDKIHFIRDEDGIKEATRNSQTYLGGNNPDETQELLDLIIHKVKVDKGSAVIVYEVPMPSDEGSQGVLQDLVTFN